MMIPLETGKQKIDSYEKGKQFEEYVKNLFNEQNFKLIDWRKSEKFEYNSLPKNHSDPDLELRFGRGQYKFAVECKWRQEFNDGIFWWDKKSINLELYKKYSRENHIPVFIVIGIGGNPSSPKKMYVTPLERIRSTTEICESDLIPYRRKPTHKFYYDIKQMRLF